MHPSQTFLGPFCSPSIPTLFPIRGGTFSPAEEGHHCRENGRVWRAAWAYAPSSALWELLCSVAEDRMILWVDQTRDHSWDKTHSQGMWFYQRPWYIPSRREMQVFPLYPTSLSLEKATWSLGHSCPCDIMAVSSSTILPASAKTNGAATREGYEHLNHCPKTMGSKCSVRLRHSLPQGWGVPHGWGKLWMTSRTLEKNRELELWELCTETGPHSCFLPTFWLQKPEPEPEPDNDDLEKERKRKVGGAQEHVGTSDHWPSDPRVPGSKGFISSLTGISSVVPSCPGIFPPYSGWGRETVETQGVSNRPHGKWDTAQWKLESWRKGILGLEGYESDWEIVKVLVVQPCSTLCKPMDCSPPVSSVYGILQVRILEWVAIPFSRGSSRHRDPSQSPAFQADSLPSEPPGKSSGSQKKWSGGSYEGAVTEVASQAGIWWAKMQATNSEFNPDEDPLVPHIYVWSSGSESVSTDSMNLWRPQGKHILILYRQRHWLRG